MFSIKKPKLLLFPNFSSFKLKLSTFAGAFMLPISTIAILGLFLVIGSFLESINDSTNTWYSRLGFMIKSLSVPVLKSLPLLFCVSFTIAYTKNDGYAVVLSIITYLTFIYIQNGLIWPTTDGNKIWFDWLGRKGLYTKILVHNLLGATTLNTSIIGSIIIGGFLVPNVIKKYSEIQLPKYISFFSGKRFLPMACVLYAVPVALLFIIFWPWIGMGIMMLGHEITKIPYGIDSFVFGVLEKALIPLGLHHIFASSFWYTSLGGNTLVAFEQFGTTGEFNQTTSIKNGALSPSIKSSFYSTFKDALGPYTSWEGDSFIGVSILSLPSNQFPNGGKKIFEYFSQTLNMQVGRFTQGKFPIMQFCLPAAGMAMIYAAPKNRKKEAISAIVPSMLTSAIIGITEPMEFTFLYIAPFLFYGFHVIMCGVSFMLMNILGAHIPTVFSGGFIEFIIFGVIPFLKGTNFWISFVVGAILAPIYFSVFYTSIIFFDLKTPGRTNQTNINNIKVKQKNNEKDKNLIPNNIKMMAIGLGGWKNISKYSNCASRLRYDVVEKTKVNEDILKSSGAIAVKWIGENHIQIILGPQANNINSELVKWKDSDLSK